MLEENKNLKSQIKDTERKSFTSYDTSTSLVSLNLTYNKTNKLISALYIVTDIMDTGEPIKNKLRNLGLNILSDIHSFSKGHDLFHKINHGTSEVLALLEIASSVGIVSTMNASILMKEFTELRKSITELAPKNDHEWLEEFLASPTKNQTEEMSHMKEFSIGRPIAKIGIQKGSTLMKALSDRIPALNKKDKYNNIHRNENIDVLKNKRREEIILIIKDKMKSPLNIDGVTITDIKTSGLPAGAGQGALASCGEKTLQRELVSMVSDGILKKKGEKRWSKYSINN